MRSHHATELIGKGSLFTDILRSLMSDVLFSPLSLPPSFSPSLPPSVSPSLYLSHPQEQLVRSLLLSLLVFLGLACATDGIPTFVQPRSLPHALEPIGLPPPSPASSPSLLSWPSGYRFVLLQVGPLVLTRRAARLAATAASLCFLVRGGEEGERKHKRD